MRLLPDANYNPRLGTDLSDDHPVSMVYNTTLDTAFNPIATVKSDGLRFFGAGVNEVQCATCHNPHEAGNEKFLRIANADSDLCLTCHIK